MGYDDFRDAYGMTRQLLIRSSFPHKIGSLPGSVELELREVD